MKNDLTHLWLASSQAEAAPDGTEFAADIEATCHWLRGGPFAGLKIIL
jgi:hypothetical protein